MYFEIIKGFAQYYITKNLAKYFDVFRYPPAPEINPDNFYQSTLSNFWLLKVENEYRILCPDQEKIKPIEIVDENGILINTHKTNNSIILQKEHIDLKEKLFLKKKNNQLIEIKERLLPIDGLCNFRDLGGYANESGKQIMWGKIFRADFLADLSSEGKKQFEQFDFSQISYSE